MTQHNIHGDFTMTFENRLLDTATWGATNSELGFAWFNSMKKHLDSSQEKYSVPWVIINDLSRWEMSSTDSWDVYDDVVSWVDENNCLLIAFVVKNQVHSFALRKIFPKQSIVGVFSSYAEAHQACLEKLAESQRQ